MCSQIKYGCSLRTVKDGFVLEFANDEIGPSCAHCFSMPAYDISSIDRCF